MTPNEARKEYFYSLMRQDLAASERAYRSASGTTVAEDGEFYRLRRLFWQKLVEGLTVEAAIGWFDAEWRAYAQMNNKKVDTAAKFKRGPYEGTSVIHYRWVSPEKVVSSSPHLREMARMADRKVSALERSTATV